MRNNPGSRVTAAGLAVILFAVSAGLGSGDVAVLLSLVGVLVGASLVAVGVRRIGGEEPTTQTGHAALAGVLAFLLPVAGIILASSAVTVVAGEAKPVLSFSMFGLFLLGLCFIYIRVWNSSQSV